MPVRSPFESEFRGWICGPDRGGPERKRWGYAGESSRSLGAARGRAGEGQEDQRSTK
jgi:hypothetical protein